MQTVPCLAEVLQPVPPERRDDVDGDGRDDEEQVAHWKRQQQIVKRNTTRLTEILQEHTECTKYWIILKQCKIPLT